MSVARTIRAKFEVQHVTKFAHAIAHTVGVKIINGVEINLNAVNSTNECSATPNSSIRLCISGETDFFKPGSEYYVDFTPASQ